MTGWNQQASGRSIAAFYEHPEWFKPTSLNWTGEAWVMGHEVD